MLILCPLDCQPHQQFDKYNGDQTDIYAFPSQAACIERRNLIREQANVFVLSAECYRVVSNPVLRVK